MDNLDICIQILTAIFIIIILACCCYFSAHKNRKSPIPKSSSNDSQSCLLEQRKSNEPQRSSESSRRAEMSEVGLRCIQDVPTPFKRFINETIIEYFKDQRSLGQQQFAVVLVSDRDFYNTTHNTMSFAPNKTGRPVLDREYSVMPRDKCTYHNYIVARPEDNNHHSEEEIFRKTLFQGNEFDRSVTHESHFTYLWRAYRNRHNTPPKYILLYSWNQPCSRCTDVIIEAFEESPYNHANVTVVYTTNWASEDKDEQEAARNKLVEKGITVIYVRYPKRIPPGS